MDNNIKVENGNLSALCSVTLAFVSWFTPENVEYALKFFVAIGSIGTAIMAVRYYYFATVEKKQQIKEHDGNIGTRTDKEKREWQDKAVNGKKKDE